MPLRERIEAAVSKNAEIFEDPEFIRLRDFYENMKARGSVIKKVYEFPARDAWGPLDREQAANVLRASNDESTPNH